MEVINKLTIEEKAALLEGHDSWKTNEIIRLKIRSLYLTDGPHGLRKVRESAGGFAVSNNEHSTAFPTSISVASSWNKENAYKMGQAIADECLQAGVDVLLAPGVNIKRSSLCGRNFEYYSEDPLVSGVFGEFFVKGVQDKGIGCSVKHFAANSNENYRFNGNSLVDERALREIYLRAFERIIKNSKPYTIMCSYNRLNGTYASQNKKLLTDILRDEWKYNGLVMTDWGATCDRVEGIKAGCDLDMPGDVIHNRNSIINAYHQEILSEDEINCSIERILKLIDKCSNKISHKNVDMDKNAELSCEIAKDSAVLLKNDGVLPLESDGEFLIIGEMFEKIRYQGAGSSLINPRKAISARDAFDARNINYIYKKGYCSFNEATSEDLSKSAMKAAESAKVILFFGGLSDFDESEGFDRENMLLPERQIAIINELAKIGKQVVFVLHTGSPVKIPCFNELSAVLNMHLSGMYGGKATAALLFGETNPSGKLAESWTMSEKDSSCYADYNHNLNSEYYESIYVGYRFYDKAKTKLQFTFGYGLSYTSFEYKNISVKEKNNKIIVQANISNTGKVSGAEVVQLYVGNPEGEVFKAEKELRAFEKVYLEAGETKSVSLEFDKHDLSYWNITFNDWVLENGEYKIMLAASSVDIRLIAYFIIDGERNVESPYTKEVMDDYRMPPKSIPLGFKELLGYEIPNLPSRKSLTMESSLENFNRGLIGRIFYLSVMHVVRKDYKKAFKMPDSIERDMQLKNSYFVVRLMPKNTIRSMSMSSGGRFPYNVAEGIVKIINGHIIKGLKDIF